MGPRGFASIVLFALFAAVTIAQPNKPPEKWSYEEAYRILTDSPWAPARNDVFITFEHQTIYRDTYAGVPTPGEITPRRQEAIASRIYPGGTSQLPAISVLWWSSRAVRLAHQRVAQFRKILPASHRLEAPPLEQIQIVVEGSEPLRILREVGEKLRETVYLELPGGQTVEPSSIEFIEGDRAGDDRVAFYFPRKIEGWHTVNPLTESVTFVCKVVSANQEKGRPNSLSLRVTFHPNQMRLHGSPDF